MDYIIDFFNKDIEDNVSFEKFLKNLEFVRNENNSIKYCLQKFDKYVLTVGEDVAYLKLPKHPKSLTPGAVKKTLRLLECIPGYKGPDIYLDFNKDAHLIGIEILE